MQTLCVEYRAISVLVLVRIALRASVVLTMINVEVQPYTLRDCGPFVLFRSAVIICTRWKNERFILCFHSIYGLVNRPMLD